LTGLGATTLAIAMIAAFLLILGGIKLALRKESRGRGFLMVVAAAVLVMNVLIWTL
jgi:high-affinity Fe2+/Pb2+ permease